MEYKETSLRTDYSNRMLEDSEYFKYIFKKTEKIACAIFFILRSDNSISHNDHVVLDLENAAKVLLDVSLDSLKRTHTTIDERAIDLRHALLLLESRLRVAYSARIIPSESLTVFSHEIDTVHRSLRKYIESNITNPLTEIESEPRARKERQISRVKNTPREYVQTETPSESGQSRRDRILNVLRDKGEATIKDIGMAVTDCSEKTIQRELISLIKDNIVLRTGERRWSKYSII